MTTPRQRPRAHAHRRDLRRHRRVSLSETLDRVLHKGVVLTGDIVISVADVDLVYISLNALIASVDTVQQWSEQSRTNHRAAALARRMEA